MTAQQPKSCKKGSSRVALDHCDFSGCWTPFWGSQSPNLSKRGLAAAILDLHDPTFHFLAAGPLFVLSAVWAQKGVQRHMISDLLPLPASWTPFCAVSGLDPPKRDPPQWNFKLAPGSAFLVALPHTEERFQNSHLQPDHGMLRHFIRKPRAAWKRGNLQQDLLKGLMNLDAKDGGTAE